MILQKFGKQSEKKLSLLGSESLQTLVQCIASIHKFSSRTVRSSKDNPDALDVYEKAEVLTKNCEALGSDVCYF